MSFQPDRGFRDHLMRRVRRHSTLATLFRAPSSPEPANLIDTNQQTLAAPDIPPGIVQARLGGVASAVAVTPPVQPVTQIRAPYTARTPEAAQVSQVRAADTGQTADRRPTAPEPTRVQSQRPAKTPSVPVLQSPPSRASAPAMPAEDVVTPTISTPEMETESNMPDSVWQRLQTIFRRHQNPPSVVQTNGNQEQPLPAEQAIDNQPLTLPSQQDEVVSASEDTARVEPSGPSQTPLLTPSTPRPPGSIQRSPQIEKEPATLQRSIEPIIQTESEVERPIPTLSVRVETPTTSEITDVAARAPAGPGARVPVQEQSFDSALPLVSQQSAVDDTLELTSLTPLTGSSSTTPVRPGDSHATAVERAAPSAAERTASAPTPNHESTQINQTEALDTGENTTAAVVTQSSPSPQIQRLTAPINSQNSPLPPQMTVKNDLAPETQPRDEVTHADSFASPSPEVNVGEQQTVPLQDAWQVERLPTRATAPEPVLAKGVMQRSEDPYNNAIQDSISRVLSNVAAGRPTTSSIEVVAPRHPRPVPVNVSGRVQRATIMREPASPQDHQQIPVRTQERSLPGVDNGVETADGVVNTSIGPLPADLWTLIDEPVPPTVRRQSNILHDASGTEYSEQASAVSQAPTAIQGTTEVNTSNRPFPDIGTQVRDRREFRAAPTSPLSKQSRPAITPSPVPVTQSPPHIQRVAEQSGGDTQTSNVEQRQSASPDAIESGQEQQQAQSPAESNVDIDDLARKVYAEVKRKLTVEWERLRTRF